MTRPAPLLLALALLVSVIGTGCRELTEQEALELAREEVREEMQPEIARRQKEITRLEKEIERTRARIAERRSR